MKPPKSSRFAFIFTAASLVACSISYSQPTLEIDPTGEIPSGHTQVFNTEWDSDASTESWTTANFTLASGTPTGGLLTGTSSTTDAQIQRTGLALQSSTDSIIEFKLTRQADDTSPIFLFWEDSAGGFGGGRSFTIPGASIFTDGAAHTYRITFSGQVSGNFKAFRLDPTETNSKTVSVDYFRAYSVPAVNLSWDPIATSGVTLGGPGTWDTGSTANWWDGTTNVVWPSTSGTGGNIATFAGAGGTVTIDPAGVTANTLSFTTAGYTVTGGPLNLDGISVLRSPAVTTNIVSQLAAAASVRLEGLPNGSFVLRGDNTTLTVPITATCNNIGITHNSALGTGTYTARNPFISALDGDRTIANNVVFALNRVIVDSDALGTGLTVGNLTINGTLALNLAAPGDLFLRRNLTVNGVVSGNNTSNGLFLDGDSGTLTLTNPGNTFTGGIKWRNSSVVAASSDAALGNSANSLNMNGVGSNPTLRLLAAFNSARNIVIDSRGTGATGASTTTGRIDTNGFDSTWTGTISAPVFSTPAVAQQNTGFAKLGAGILTLNPGVSDNNLRSGGILVSGGTLRIASGTFSTGSANSGVRGGSLLEVNGGSLATGNFGVGNSAGTGTFTLNTGGTYTNGAEFLISFGGGDGVCNINGGLADLNQFSMVNAAPNTSTMNLNGGEVRLNFFNARANAVTPATAIINFNGSLVRAKSSTNNTTNFSFIETDSTTAITANVQAGGAIFNTRNAANTTSYNITIQQPLIHDPALGATLDGGLTKNGLGTLTLAPLTPNTYTGPTTANAGILAVNGSAIDDAGSLNILTGGKVSIPADTNEVVSALFLDGAEQLPGVYGSSASGAPLANQNDAYFDVTGTGTITVASAANNFAAWLTANPPATGFTTDSDNDGIPNGAENVLGTSPNAASTGLTEISATATAVTFKHTLNPTIASDVNYSYEWSSELVEWQASGVANAAGTIGTIVPSLPVSDVVSVTTTRTGTVSSKLFTRIKATNP